MGTKKIETAVEETAVSETPENNVVSNTEEVKDENVEKVSSKDEEKEKSEEDELEKEEKSEKKAKASENKKVKLKILIAFSDKYDRTIDYKENDIVEFEKERAEELLSDTRRLVKKAD